ncbi:Origin recognition complex subunit 2 [Mycena venus]|uniref:Origin recognition complex subunit 2 n=1 Tax=Mycena venus TaxID=2733690 RepID=A0A8H6Y262_9AGAR|nr:Origin recognition complex subunit 2 [Mycena venus]
MPPSDSDDSDALSDASEVEAILTGKGKGKATATDDDNRVIVQSSFDAYFALSAAKASTSSNIFSSLIQPLSAEEYAESIAVDAPGSKHLQSSILLEPARSALFSRLLCELNEGFNLICYGFGSKRKLLDDFASSRCSKAGHVVVVNGFQPELSVKDVLNSIENIPGITALPLPTSTVDGQARRIYDFFSQSSPKRRRHLYLVIHNIDAFFVRTPKAKACLSLLALHPHIHLIASVDHLNSPLLWSSSEVSVRKDGLVAPGKTPPRGYAWLWHDLTTLAPYDFELSFADRTSVTGAHTSRKQRADAAVLPSGVAMTETAAKHVLAAVNDRAQKLFNLMGQRQLEAIDTGDPNVDGLREFAVPYDVLFPLARQNFIAVNDTAMRSLLGEFRDHGLVVSAQASSGGEVLWIPLRKESLGRSFFASRAHWPAPQPNVKDGTKNNRWLIIASISIWPIAVTLLERASRNASSTRPPDFSDLPSLYIDDYARLHMDHPIPGQFWELIDHALYQKWRHFVIIAPGSDSDSERRASCGGL